VYYAEYGSIVEAIASEKKLKNFSRKKKIKLIEDVNPEWDDLYYWLL
jgi:putative endonuclease